MKKTTKSRPKKTTTKTKTAASKEPTKADSKAPAKAKPQKPAFDAEFLKQVRDEMVDERRSLLSMMQSTQQQLAGRDTGLADLSDIASGGFEDELAIGLMASEAATLEKIDAAIKRIDDGTYGICLECEKPIPKKRLEFLPFAQRCMECEGNRERRVRMGTMND
ncbi:MAG: TraR/DksA family transcriptional regulator [Phycisphaerales bacterium]|nr:TraR/DksA family transcriptional regulator [Phycisphaerales bacterium]